MIQKLMKQKVVASHLPASGARRRPLRPHPEPFARLDVSGPCCRPSQISREVAAGMTILIGPDSVAQERYLDALSYAERCHLASLAKRRCAILMAPSIPLGLDSMPASSRRGRTLTVAETAEVRREFGPESGVIAIYEPTIDALVMPTARTVPDPEHAVLHELGHALTYSRIDDLDPALLSLPLPRDIARHLEQPGYRGDRRSQLAELMAEAYAWLVVGRVDELAPGILSALHAILPLDVEFTEDPL